MLDVSTLWIGSELPPYVSACLASFPRLGHKLTLYLYSPTGNLPPTVGIGDANSIVDRGKLDPFAAIGKYAQFANYFRYELLTKRNGTCWIDTDVFCLRPITAEPFIFGREDDAVINNGVLALPHEHPMLAKLRDMFRMPNFVPPWLPRRQYLSYRIAAALGRPIPREKFDWGVLGPRAVTWYAHQYHLEGFAKPPETFYPIHFREINKFFDPSVDWEQRISPVTKTVHLWNEFLRKRADRYAPPHGSFMWKLLNGKPII